MIIAHVTILVLDKVHGHPVGTSSAAQSRHHGILARQVAKAARVLVKGLIHHEWVMQKVCQVLPRVGITRFRQIDHLIGQDTQRRCPRAADNGIVFAYHLRYHATGDLLPMKATAGTEFGQHSTLPAIVSHQRLTALPWTEADGGIVIDVGETRLGGVSDHRGRSRSAYQ